MHEMMDFQLVRQRHAAMLREAELNRQAKALRATRKRLPTGDQLWYGR